ncbi:MAG: branched-chain amino acid transaminase [Candidatus Nitrosoabyssus spongiisocia]|nr:MAG: branched-chain amino acid transaminase [Nitrosopumilaceae archaeon AB1(1)]
MKNDIVWFDKKFMSINKATVPITTHAIHYGTSAFEGIRAYWNGENLYIFRLDNHIKRFKETLRYYNLKTQYSEKILKDAIINLCKKNKIKHSCYIRPVCFVGNHGIQLHIRGAPTHVCIFTLTFDDIFNKNGINMGISQWRKFSNKSTPMQAKMGGNYLNSIIATNDARSKNFDEALLLDMKGNVSEAPGENIFILKNNNLITPKISSALDGITKKTVFEIAKKMKLNVKHDTIAKRQLFTADEIFITGTATEIVPIISIDKRKISHGRIGIMTRKIMSRYMDITSNRDKKYSKWLTKVY